MYISFQDAKISELAMQMLKNFHLNGSQLAKTKKNIPQMSPP